MGVFHHFRYAQEVSCPVSVAEFDHRPLVQPHDAPLNASDAGRALCQLLLIGEVILLPSFSAHGISAKLEIEVTSYIIL